MSIIPAVAADYDQPPLHIWRGFHHFVHPPTASQIVPVPSARRVELVPTCAKQPVQLGLEAARVPTTGGTDHPRRSTECPGHGLQLVVLPDRLLCGGGDHGGGRRHSGSQPRPV